MEVEDSCCCWTECAGRVEEDRIALVPARAEVEEGSFVGLSSVVSVTSSHLAGRD